MFRRKSLETLVAEANSEGRLHRALGKISLTSLGIGAIIGAGIFAMTGRVAANDAGPAIMVSFIVAGIACALAAMCYAEFAAMVPVAGSAYTYTYATLGELLAWIIGWDLILEYGMSAAVVAAHWTHYLDEFIKITTGGWHISPIWTFDPFTTPKVNDVPIMIDGKPLQAICNLPAVLISLLVTGILVVGIRESAWANLALVILKVAVVLFVIALGVPYVSSANWTSIPKESRKITNVQDFVDRHPDVAARLPAGTVTEEISGEQLIAAQPEAIKDLSAADRELLRKTPNAVKKWGLLGVLGVQHVLNPLDEKVRSNFFPYGFTGVMIGASIVFFAFMGFDSISTHAEEAINPQKDVPFGIIASMVICTVLYMLMSGVITGMQPYYQIDTGAPIAAAFRVQAEKTPNIFLNISAGLIAAGALAGMTSVILVMFLSQSRIFLAMARDGLLPRSIFGVVHKTFKTPHRSTILTGVLMALFAGFVPIRLLEEMVNIGTLLAFVLVCGSVLNLRIRRPELHRPFVCPALYLVAPLGILANLSMMLFLPIETWVRLVVWLLLGLVLYFCYGFWYSQLDKPKAPLDPKESVVPAFDPPVTGI